MYKQFCQSILRFGLDNLFGKVKFTDDSKQLK